MLVKRTTLRRKLLSSGFALFLTATLLQTTACHRGYYRRQADAEAVKLISEKSNDPRWDLPDRSIDIDPRSRMAHPFSSDHPPMPPDDPASNEFMRCVDGKPGYPHWNANGNLAEVENPDWMSFVPVNEKGALVLDLNRAVRVAYLHSPTYQNQRETLYLSALDVSLERFGFDAQLFASYNAFQQFDGRIRGGGNSSSTLTGSTGARGIRLQKLGITGSTLVAGLANTMLWQFSGPNSNSTTTLLDFSLIQPLLRGAGRERILEALTQAERTLLANVRQMERYRRGFYLNVATGRNPGQGPSRGGNFLGTPSSQGSNAGGFLGLIQTRQNIAIQEYNVSQLREVLLQFRYMQENQKIDALQVSQVETQLYRAQQSLFNAIVGYESTLDQFKISLGLPPEMKIEIDDPLLNQFQLIDLEAIGVQDDINDLKEEISLPVIALSEIVSDKSREVPAEPVDPADVDAARDISRDKPGFRWGDDVTKSLETLDQYLDKVDEARKIVLNDQVGRVRKDIEKLRSSREEVVSSLKEMGGIDLDNGLLEDSANGRLSRDLISEAAIVKAETLEVAVEEAIEKLENDIPDKLSTIRANIKDLIENHKDDYATKEKLTTEVMQSLPQVLADVSSQSLELLLQQVLARTDQLKLTTIDLQSEVAIAVAKHFRRDWMNARASLVDSWRQIEFQADQLESTFDLVLEGDIGTVGDNPLNFRTANSRLRGGFRFDSPITRMQERNNYRQALISYQQARRQYYQVRDEIARNLRQILRQVELQKVIFELSRLQIKVSVRQVDQARFAVSEPPTSVGGRQANPTLGRNLTDAINSLQQAQTSFLNTFVSYEVLRRGLDFDLGTMNLDENSLWIDPGPINREFIDLLVAQDQALLQELGVDQLYDSVDQFLEETTPDLDGETAPSDPNSPMNDPIDGTPDTPTTESKSPLDATLEEDDKLLMDLKKRLRNEMIRTASLPKAELPFEAQAPINTAQLPPVDVSRAFPSLPATSRPVNTSPVTTDQVPGRESTPIMPSLISPKKFKPILE